MSLRQTTRSDAKQCTMCWRGVTGNVRSSVAYKDNRHDKDNVHARLTFSDELHDMARSGSQYLPRWMQQFADYE